MSAIARSATSKISPPASSRTTSTSRPSLASNNRSRSPSGDPSIAASAPKAKHNSRFSGDDAVAITRPAPSGLASCTASEPTPPAPLTTSTDSPARIRAQVRYRCHAVNPCNNSASAVPSSSPAGIGNVRSAGASAYSA